MYKLKVYIKTELDRTELTKQGKWKYFSWDAYKKIVQDRRTTPTHITHYDQIIITTKPKCLQKASKTKGTVKLTQILKRSKQKKPVAYIAKLCTYR